MNITWKKYRAEYKSIEDRFKFDETDESYFSGLVNILAEDQTYNDLSKDHNETLQGNIDKVPFVVFKIVPVEDYFGLISISSVSLNSYMDISNNRCEKWGTFETIEECKAKALNVIQTFKANFGSKKECLYYVRCNKCVVLLTSKDIDKLLNSVWDFKVSFAWRVAEAIEAQRMNYDIYFEVVEPLFKDMVNVLIKSDY